MLTQRPVSRSVSHEDNLHTFCTRAFSEVAVGIFHLGSEGAEERVCHCHSKCSDDLTFKRLLILYFDWLIKRIFTMLSWVQSLVFAGNLDTRNIMIVINIASSLKKQTKST